MTINATSEEELRKLRTKVAKAHAWALQHFNNSRANDTRLVDDNLAPISAWFVKFPYPDIMIASPSFMGKPSWLDFPYALVFCKDGSTKWVGRNPMNDAKLELPVPVDFKLTRETVLEPVEPLQDKAVFDPSDVAMGLLLLNKTKNNGGL